MIETTGLKQGDLCAFSVYAGRLVAGVYRGEGQGTYQFWRLNEYTADMLKEGKKAPIDYLGGSNRDNRVVKIDASVLNQEEREAYYKIKELVG